MKNKINISVDSQLMNSGNQLLTGDLYNILLGELFSIQNLQNYLFKKYPPSKIQSFYNFLTILGAPKNFPPKLCTELEQPELQTLESPGETGKNRPRQYHRRSSHKELFYTESKKHGSKDTGGRGRKGKKKQDRRHARG